MIKPYLLPGDLIVVLMPLYKDKPIVVSPEKLVNCFTNSGYQESLEDIHRKCQLEFKVNGKPFISVSRLTALTIFT